MEVLWFPREVWLKVPYTTLSLLVMAVLVGVSLGVWYWLRRR